MPVLRRCVAPADTTLLTARCQRPGQPIAGSFLLLLTNRHLIISREGRLLHRIHLHLAAPLRELADVTWVPDARLHAIELAFTAPDGVRERFWIPIRTLARVSHVDALFSHAFRGARTINRYGPGRRTWPLTTPAPAPI